MSQEKVFQARKDQSFPWFETSQEQQESLVNECHWEGRVLFTQPIVIEDTIDTPEFNNLLGQYAASIENYRENHASLVAHIDAHAAAVAAKAVADERKRLKAQIAHLTHERDLALRANRAAAPQQHAQAAKEDECPKCIGSRVLGEVRGVHCSTCKGTGVVDDGEIDCYPNGEPYMNGPVKCVKDCPDCSDSRVSGNAQAALSEVPQGAESQKLCTDAFAKAMCGYLYDNKLRDFARSWFETGWFCLGNKLNAIKPDAEPLCDFKEGQWWVNELDRAADISTEPDVKRAVAVVHHLLRSITASQKPPAPADSRANGNDAPAVQVQSSAIPDWLKHDMAYGQNSLTKGQK